jgi:thiamine-phosphate pyrophosphorylase
MIFEATAWHGIHVLADDDPRWARNPVEQARSACEAGAAVVQLRTKHATDSQMLAWARQIRALTREHNRRFIVNDRYDIALLAEADGVHLGQTDLPPDALPSEARARLAIGRSTHTVEQLEAAGREDVDYVAFGPVFGTTSKDSDYTARGLEALERAVALASPRPLVAIGGIGLAEAPAVRATGAAGIAVISVVAGSPDPAAAARRLRIAFEGHTT